MHRLLFAVALVVGLNARADNTTSGHHYTLRDAQHEYRFEARRS